MTRGWYNNKQAHSLASRGIKTNICNTIIDKEYFLRLAKVSFGTEQLIEGGIVKNEEEHIKNIIEDLQNLCNQDRITVYRVVWKNSIYNINQKKLGNHFTTDLGIYNESFIDELYIMFQRDFMKEIPSSKRHKIKIPDKHDDLYLIKTEIRPEDIKINETFLARVEYPFEKEIWVKTTTEFENVEISKFYN